jgi:hypothetical protein
MKKFLLILFNKKKIIIFDVTLSIIVNSEDILTWPQSQKRSTCMRFLVPVFCMYQILMMARLGVQRNLCFSGLACYLNFHAFRLFQVYYIHTISLQVLLV